MEAPNWHSPSLLLAGIQAYSSKQEYQELSQAMDVGGVFPGIGLQSPFKIESLSIFDKRPNINDNILVNRLWWSWRWAFLGNPYWNTAYLSESDRPCTRSSQGTLWNANGEICVCVFFPSCRSLHRSEEYQCFMAFLQVVCVYYEICSVAPASRALACSPSWCAAHRLAPRCRFARVS